MLRAGVERSGGRKEETGMEGRERKVFRSLRIWEDTEEGFQSKATQLEPRTLHFLLALPASLLNEELQVMSEENVPGY